MKKISEKKTGRTNLKDRITAVVEPFCFSENVELVHVECVYGKRETLVRLYMDKPGGITLDDCVTISRQLGDLIEIEVDDLGPWRLEVSSPGVDRPLNKPGDFIRFKGHRVKVEINEPIENRKNFTGILEDADNESIVIAYDGKKLTIQSEQISKACLADLQFGES